jgi:hypothetical protein
MQTAQLKPTILLTTLAMLAACGGDPTGPPPSPPPPAAVVASVAVTSPQELMAVGQSMTLIAVPKNAAGELVEGIVIGWGSSAPTTIAVSGDGRVTALAAGQAIITATAGGKQGTVTITAEVAPVPGIVDRVDLDRVTLNLAEGDDHQFVATPRDPNGAPVNGLGMTWTSSAPDVASVQPGHGLVTALRPGSATITVRVHGKTASAVVQVASTHSHDLVYTAWYGVAGTPPVLDLVDPRDSTRTATTLLPVGTPGAQPAPSPDGSKVLFTQYTAWGDRKLFLFDRATGTVAPFSNDAMWIPAHDDSPAWSPDGLQVAFRRQAPGEGGRIWVSNADGSNPRHLTADDSTATLYHPTWSPNLPGEGYRIAYTREAGGAGHLWTMRADGSDKRQLTSGAVYDNMPAWSPDGATIAFVRHGISSNLMAVDVATDSIRVLLAWPMHQFFPAWSPDGKQVAFVSGSGTGGTSQVYTLWATGFARVAQRTNDDTEKAQPAWIRRP